MADINTFVDGWSQNAQEASYSSNLGTDSSYSDTGGATWFFRSWWWNGTSGKIWGRKFKNTLGTPVRLASISFEVCPGHSNGLTFMSDSGIVGQVDGGACTFQAEIYLPSATKQSYSAQSDSVVLDAINQFNCSSSNGPGTTDTQSPWGTGFGSPYWFGPNSGRYRDSNNHIRCRQSKTLTFATSPIIQPNGTMYLIVKASSWTSQNALLRISPDIDTFIPEYGPIESPYIWRYNSSTSQWEKVLYAYVRSGNTWNKLGS